MLYREFRPLVTPAGGICIFFLALQQALVALSILALAKAASWAVAAPTGGSGGAFATSLIIYALLIFSPYLPGVVSLWAADLWEAQAYRRFQEISLERLRPHASAFSNKRVRERTTTIFASSYQPVLDDAVRFFYTFIASVFSSVFSVAVASVIFNGGLILFYALSVVFCAVYFRLFYARSSRLGLRRERARVRMTSVATRIWPNLSIGNGINLATWRSRLRKTHQVYIRRVSAEARIKNVSNLLLAIFSFVPVGAFVIWQTLEFASSPVRLTAALVTLPRIFGILNYLSNLVFQCFDLGRIRGKLRNLWIAPLDAEMQIRKIDWAAITIMSDSGTAIPPNAALEGKDAFRKGVRYTIRGPNGSGKTTLLLAIKGSIADRGIYLPSEGQLDFPNTSWFGSTGEVKLAYLKAISKLDEIDFLLLDEWDANLDADAVTRINSELDKLSKRGNLTVIEARHRFD